MTVPWFAALVGIAMALELAVLAVSIGPPNVGVEVVIAASALVGIGGGVAFWRRVGGRASRRRVAAAPPIVTIAWAALSALTVAWFLVAFSPVACDAARPGRRSRLSR